MINTIGILDLAGLPYDETTITKKGVGGSETWVIYISEALARIPNTRIYRKRRRKLCNRRSNDI